jgi:hypothetical protein
MAARRPGADADGVLFFTPQRTSKPGAAAMQFLNSSPSFWSHSKHPQGMQPRMTAKVANGGGGSGSGNGNARKLDCGWYDSSFELSQGLEVSEQDNDAIYQLWQLSLN